MGTKPRRSGNRLPGNLYGELGKVRTTEGKKNGFHLGVHSGQCSAPRKKDGHDPKFRSLFRRRLTSSDEVMPRPPRPPVLTPFLHTETLRLCVCRMPFASLSLFTWKGRLWQACHPPIVARWIVSAVGAKRSVVTTACKTTPPSRPVCRHCSLSLSLVMWLEGC